MNGDKSRGKPGIYMAVIDPAIWFPLHAESHFVDDLRILYKPKGQDLALLYTKIS